MTFFRKIAGMLRAASFRAKLAAVSLLVSCVAMTASAIGFIGVQSSHERALSERHFMQVGEVLAANLGTALVHHDMPTINAILHSARNVPNIVWLDLDDAQGKDLAAYHLASMSAQEFDTLEQNANLPGHGRASANVGDFGILRVPVLSGGTQVGALVFGYRHRSLGALFIATLPVASAVLAVCMLLGVSLASVLRGMALRPFDQLLATMRDVHQSGELGARVPRSDDADFDILIDSFNAMIDEIDAKNARLAKTLAELGETRDAAQAANVAKSEFLANMSHELRTPLNAIIGYAEVLREDLGKAGLTRSLEDVGWIWSSSYQLLELINSLLDLSKIEAGHMELDIHSFSLPSLMAETEALLTPLAKRGNNTLSVHVDPALDTINGDSTKLRQCLLNLGSNACKFTKDGFVELHARAEGNTLVLEVSDTGIGLSEETIAKLFKPFVQSDSSTTRNYGGTGLGLALVDRFGKMMGGNVSVVSEPGYGSVFALHVPLDMGEPARQSAPQSQKPVQKTQRSQPLALVVEDEPSSLELLRRMLERNGYDVMQASDGHTALEMALDALPDVILLDITLPRLDGWAVLDQMAQDPQLAAIPTIVISVDDRKRISLEKGASDHLVKPVKVDELEDILRLYSIPHAGRILLVEDDDATANLYKSGLEQAGYVVERTDNAHIGLERARNGSFGLVIADLHLPDSDAFAMIEAIADITTPARLPVLIITGRSLTPEKRQELEAHSQAIVLKSGLSPRMLVANVQEMLRAA